jgi:hypothetical protein
MSDGKASLDWAALSADRQRVMMSGVERHFLSEVVVHWMALSDADFSNRGYKYVPSLMKVATSLVEEGLLTVVPNETTPQPLTKGDALAVASDFGKWWVYDPELSDEDPEDNGADPVGDELRSSRGVSYLLTDTNHGDYSIINWSPPSPMDPIAGR